MKFSEVLIQQAEPHWQKATDHVFIREMVEGSLDKSAFADYLVQDYCFIGAFLDAISYAIAYSQTMEQKHRLSTFLSTVTSEENDYFIRSFKALGVNEADYLTATKPSPAIKGFHQAIDAAINSDKVDAYANCLVIIACAESVYCEWGMRHREKSPTDFYFNEWLTLHNNDDFQSFVAWLKTELDSLGDCSRVQRQHFIELFQHICQLEAQFFDECYKKPLF